MKNCPFCGSDDLFQRIDVIRCQKCSAEADVDDWDNRYKDEGVVDAKWVRFNGFAETLPDCSVKVIVKQKCCDDWDCAYYDDDDEGYWDFENGSMPEVQIGDMWAYVVIPERD